VFFKIEQGFPDFPATIIWALGSQQVKTHGKLRLVEKWSVKEIENSVIF